MTENPEGEIKVRLLLVGLELDRAASVMSARVDSVPEHGDGREVALDAGEVLNVVKPPGHVGVLLPLLDGRVSLVGRERGEWGGRRR